MRQYFRTALVFINAFILASCSAISPYPYPSADYTNEKWQFQVQTSSKYWRKGADYWFLSKGLANRTERWNMGAPRDEVISTMHVKVPYFDKIKVNGLFQVQIFGTDEQNSVDIYGPNRGVRATAVEVKDGMLSVFQTEVAPNDIDKTIIRIGVKNLRELIQKGCGSIDGIYIRAKELTISSRNGANGNIYLEGAINLRRVIHDGGGILNVFHVSSTALDIDTNGIGTVNIQGKVGIRSIMHRHGGDINIIGASSPRPLKVTAYGNGKIGIRGEVNLREVEARGNTRVYMYYVNSSRVIAKVYDNAIVGLAGRTDLLDVKTFGASLFQGRYLYARYALVSAYGTSHANVTANEEIFARAEDTASIYYFGPTNLISKFLRGRGTIIPVGFDGREVYPGFDAGYRIVPIYSTVPVVPAPKSQKIKVMRAGY